MAMPAMARPRPLPPVVLTWLSAMIPSTMPMIDPMPQKNPMTDATIEAIAMLLVDWLGAPYAPYPAGGGGAPNPGGAP